MKIAYFDCFSGISGDMTLGALVDAGADASRLEAGINSLAVEPVRLESRTRVVSGIKSTDVTVVCSSSFRVRDLAVIEQLLWGGNLSSWVRDKSLAAFRRLAEAEARVHGVPVEQVHFHEVGALDTIADIVGSFLALEQLGIGTVVASPLPWSRGLTPMAHGVYPLPAPATVELLRGIPCYGVDEELELVTPTGAAILQVMASDFGPLPPVTPQAVGYGAGKRERRGVPNLLRVVIGEETRTAGGLIGERVEVVEAQVDDMLPEHFSFLAEKLASCGVLDFYFTPVYMKKGRPGTLITVMAPTGSASQLAALLLAHTSTLGVRYWLTERSVLPRETLTVETRWGPVRVKKACLPDRPPKLAPEYEDCRSVALAHGVPLDVVYREVLRQALATMERGQA